MDELNDLFESNRRWVTRMTLNDPGFFQRLSGQQAPKYLWIGCADSRVPANEIVGLLPGELFVHRNVSNVVALDDPNCLSVIQYAIDVLHVRHIIVCGHYGCGGIEAVIDNLQLGMVDRWLKHVHAVRDAHLRELEGLHRAEQSRLLCRLNVMHQVHNVASTPMVREAWKRDQPLTIHGWTYAIDNGLLQDLHVSVDAPEDATIVTRP